MDWTVEFTEEALKDLKKIDPASQGMIRNYLRQRVLAVEDPRLLGRPLRNQLHGLWKYRVGDYRIVCRIEENRLVILVIGIGHRKNVYDSFE